MRRILSGQVAKYETLLCRSTRPAVVARRVMRASPHASVHLFLTKQEDVIRRFCSSVACRSAVPADDLDFLDDLAAAVATGTDESSAANADSGEASLTSAPVHVESVVQSLLDTLPQDGSMVPLALIGSTHFPNLPLESIADTYGSFLQFVKSFPQHFTVASSDEGGGNRVRWYLARAVTVAASSSVTSGSKSPHQTRKQETVLHLQPICPSASGPNDNTIINRNDAEAVATALRQIMSAHVGGEAAMELYRLRSMVAVEAGDALRRIEGVGVSLRHFLLYDPAVRHIVTFTHDGKRVVLTQTEANKRDAATAVMQDAYREKRTLRHRHEGHAWLWHDKEFSDDPWQVELELDDETATVVPEDDGDTDAAELQPGGGSEVVHDAPSSSARTTALPPPMAALSPAAIASVAAKGTMRQNNAVAPAVKRSPPPPLRSRTAGTPITNVPQTTAATAVSHSERDDPVSLLMRYIPTTPTLATTIRMPPTVLIALQTGRSLAAHTDASSTGLVVTPSIKLLRKFSPLYLTIDSVLGTVHVNPTFQHSLKGSCNAATCTVPRSPTPTTGAPMKGTESEIWSILDSDDAQCLWRLPSTQWLSLSGLESTDPELYAFITEHRSLLHKSAVIVLSAPHHATGDTLVRLRPIWMSPSASLPEHCVSSPSSRCSETISSEVASRIQKGLRPVWVSVDRWWEKLLDSSSKAVLTEVADSVIRSLSPSAVDGGSGGRRDGRESGCAVLSVPQRAALLLTSLDATCGSCWVDSSSEWRIRRFTGIAEMDDFEHFVIRLMFMSLPLPSRDGEAGGLVDLRQHLAGVAFSHVIQSTSGAMGDAAVDNVASFFAKHSTRFTVLRDTRSGSWLIGRYSPFRCVPSRGR